MTEAAKIRWAMRCAVFICAAMAVSACGREPLDTGDVTAPPPTSMQATSPSDDGPTIGGLWSGELPASAPGFGWGPFDRLTLQFGADDRLVALQWQGNILPPHTYSASGSGFPLQGERDAPLTGGSLYTVHVTVVGSEFAADHFRFRYRVVGTGATPRTDYIEDISGQLAGGTLRVTYSLTGTLLIAPIAATAAGNLTAS